MSDLNPNMRILVVDDETEVRATIIELLKSFGYTQIVEAVDAHDAMSRLQSNEVDFIISDWQMPGMTGLNLLKTLREQPKTRHIPFIIVTNPGSDEVMKIEEAVGAHVDAYVIKPFRGELLNSKINEVLAKHGGSPAPGGVLIVDDDAQVRALMVEILQSLGRSPILQASNGKEALELLKSGASSQVGLVISDWEMPEVTGISLLQKIRADEELAKIPFIMITSQTSIEHLKLKEAVNAHVNHYLMKPFTSKDLEAKIDTVMSKALLDRQIEGRLAQAKEAEEAGREKEARALCREALQLDPKSVRAHLALAESLIGDSRKPDFDEAIKLIKKAIQLQPGSDTGHIALAVAFENAKSLDKAIHLLEESSQKLPWSADIQFHLGRLLMRRGHIEAATACLNKAMEMKGDFAEAEQLLQSAGKK